MVLALTILIAIISVFLILIILLQNPKGGGLSSAFGGASQANQIMGAANSGNVLEKGTWILASSLLGLCLFTGIFFKTGPTTTSGPDINTNVNTTAPINTPTPGTGGTPMPPPPGNGG
jgi:preprotein translocase subunit SecG